MPSRDSAILALALGALRFSCAPLSPEEQLPLKPQLGPGKISFEPLPHPTQGPALEEKDTIMDAPRPVVPALGIRVPLSTASTCHSRAVSRAVCFSLSTSPGSLIHAEDGGDGTHEAHQPRREAAGPQDTSGQPVHSICQVSQVAEQSQSL